MQGCFQISRTAGSIAPKFGKRLGFGWLSAVKKSVWTLLIKIEVSMEANTRIIIAVKSMAGKVPMDKFVHLSHILSFNFRAKQIN